MQSWGIPADKVSELSKLQIPGNLYYEIAIRQERIAKAPEVILYDTTLLKETENLYYQDHNLYNFKSKVQAVYANVMKGNMFDIVILYESAFYPTSGGQIHDIGKFTIGNEKYDIIKVEKVGKCVLHFLDREIDQKNPDLYKDLEVICEIDAKRRNQLRAHHTGTHIMYAAAKKVLGPHVWQNGAKKTTDQAHLDITHYKSLSKIEEQEIENEANRTIMKCVKINKSIKNKADAEKEHGFRLY